MRLIREYMKQMRVEPFGMAMPGARLNERVRGIVDAGPMRRISPGHAAWIVTICAALGAAFLALAPSRAQEADGPPYPTFEVASIKPTAPEDGIMGLFLTHPGGRIEARGCTLEYLVTIAYDVHQRFQISGGEEWVRKKRFSMEAKPPAGSASTKINPSDAKSPPPQEERLMLRALLAERFQLKLKRSTQDAQGFALVLKGPHPALKPPKDKEARPVVAMGYTDEPQSPWFVQGFNAPMAKFADRLSDLLSTPVADRTGLEGNFDFFVKYATARDENATAPLLKDAIQEIGFKLEPATVTMPHIEIESAAEPSAN